MGLLAFFTEKKRQDETNADAVALRKAVMELEPQLRNDYTHRMFGDGVYSGYKVLREFYKGQQWSYRKQDNGTMRTYNYCFTIVENMTAFLTNEPPQMSAPPKDLSDPLDRALAEGKTKLLNTIHEDNALGLVFQRSARTASINGDAYIFGAIPTFKVDDDGNKTLDRIRYWNIERPEHIRPIWKDENFTEMAGFVKYYRIELETAKRLFKEELEAGKIQLVQDYDVEHSTGQVEITSVPMITVKEYWDERQYLLMVNADNKIIHYVRHNWGFVPLHYIPNIHLPGEPRGTSDLENELDPQQEYNERSSDLADIIKEMARPTYWGKNLDNLTEIRSGQTVIYQVGDDGDIQAMPRSGQTVPMAEYIDDRKNDIIGLSGMNQVLYPGNQVMQATGRALSVIMQGVNNKIALRKEWWSEAFKRLNTSILFLAEQYIPEAKLLIDGYYRTDVFISSVLLRSVSDEINKFQAKIQSLTTTQHNVGVPNPSEEQKLMKEELQDEILATEIAKQPGMLHQILAERIGQMNAATGGAMTANGLGGINGAPPPIAGEADNEPGITPAQGVASPVSPQGAIQQVASRSGALAQVAKKSTQ